MQAAAGAGAGGSYAPQQQPLDAYSRPSAPSLLDFDYAPAPGMPLSGGLAAATLSCPPVGQAARPGELPLSASGRRMSAPRLEDEAWWEGAPAVAPSRPASEPGTSTAAAAAAAAAAARPTDSTDDSAFCVVCLDNPSTSGVMHNESVHK